jgi:hypothetical protein
VSAVEGSGMIAEGQWWCPFDLRWEVGLVSNLGTLKDTWAPCSSASPGPAWGVSHF